MDKKIASGIYFEIQPATNNNEIIEKLLKNCKMHVSRLDTIYMAFL